MRPPVTAQDEEHAIVEALNQKSLEGVQSGQTPDFAGAEQPPINRPKAAHAASRTVVRRRTDTERQERRLTALTTKAMARGHLSTLTFRRCAHPHG